MGEWEEKKWRELVKKEDGLRAYSKVKTTLNMEKYLGELHGYKGRELITRFRAGALPLGIRWTENWSWRENLQGRCGYCWNISPWWHCLIECEGLSSQRERMMNKVGWKKANH